MKKYLFYLFLFLVAASSSISWAEEKDLSAIDSYLAGELEEAQEYVQKNPDDAEAYFNLATAYALLGKGLSAIDSYEEAIRIKPDFAKAHFNLGNHYSMLDKYQDAIASYKEAIHIKPDYAEAHDYLGRTYGYLRRFQEAVASYKEALRIDPSLTIARDNLNKLEKVSGGEDEVYYCAEIANNGFSYDKKNETYLRRSFKESKFKVKLYRTSNQIEMSHDDFGKLNFNCRIPFFGELNTLACHPTSGYLVNFNLDIATGRFTFSNSGGYVTGDRDSLSVSYGKCDKF